MFRTTRPEPRHDSCFEPLEARRVLAAFASPGMPVDVSLSEDDEFVVSAVDTDGYMRTFENVGARLIDGLEGDFDDILDDIFGDGGPSEDDWITRAQDDDDLGLRPQSPVVTFRSPFDGDSYAAAAADLGVVDYARDDDGTDWDSTLVTTSDDGIVVSNVVAATTSNAMYVAGLNADGDLILYQNTDGTWQQRNLSDEFFGGQGPGWTGEMFAFTTSWDAVNLVGLDASGDITTVWTAPGLNGWESSNLSAIAGAPTFTGGLSAYTTPWSGVNVTAIDTDGDLNVVWWVPQFEGDWVVTNFNDQFDGPGLMAETITSYRTPWNGLNIAGLDAQGALHVFWWVPEFAADPSNDFWRVENLSDDFDSASRMPVGPLTAQVTGDGVIGIFGVEQDAELVSIYWTSGEGWRSQNVSQDAIEL